MNRNSILQRSIEPYKSFGVEYQIPFTRIVQIVVVGLQPVNVYLFSNNEYQAYKNANEFYPFASSLLKYEHEILLDLNKVHFKEFFLVVENKWSVANEVQYMIQAMVKS